MYLSPVAQAWLTTNVARSKVLHAGLPGQPTLRCGEMQIARDDFAKTLILRFTTLAGCRSKSNTSTLARMLHPIRRPHTNPPKKGHTTG